MSAVTGAEITTIRRSPGANPRTFDLTYNLGGARQSLSISALIIATPAYESARLLHDLDRWIQRPT